MRKDKKNTPDDSCEDFTRYLHAARHHPSHDFLNGHKDLHIKMMYILFEWLFHVAVDQKLSLAECFRSYNYLRRFMSIYAGDKEDTGITRDQLQGYGVAAMALSSLYEENDYETRFPMRYSFCAYITEDVYTKQQVRGFQRIITEKLDYNLIVTTELDWLEFFSFYYFKLIKKDKNLNSLQFNVSAFEKVNEASYRALCRQLTIIVLMFDKTVSQTPAYGLAFSLLVKHFNIYDFEEFLKNIGLSSSQGKMVITAFKRCHSSVTGILNSDRYKEIAESLLAMEKKDGEINLEIKFDDKGSYRAEREYVGSVETSDIGSNSAIVSAVQIEEFGVWAKVEKSEVREQKGQRSHKKSESSCVIL